jgi:ABC-type glycerol-3-phosphate transport system substrate-binding protein
MMVDGQWLVWPNYISRFRPEQNYGVAPFPPPTDHPERADTAIIESAVIVIPAGAKDKEAAASLLAWMMSPEIMAEAMVAHASLPARRAAAEDPRFLNVPGFELFMGLVAHPNTKHVVTTSIRPELNEALEQVEREVLHKEGDPALLLDDLQTEVVSKLKETSSYPVKP